MPQRELKNGRRNRNLHLSFSPHAHLDRRRPGIHGVLHELLDGRGKVEDDRAGADAVHVLPRDRLYFVRHRQMNFSSRGGWGEVFRRVISFPHFTFRSTTTEATALPSICSRAECAASSPPLLAFLSGSRHPDALSSVAERGENSCERLQRAVSGHLGRARNQHQQRNSRGASL